MCAGGGDEKYVCRIDDMGIGMYMFNHRSTYSSEEIDLFFSLTKEKYGFLPQKDDIFMDVGANMGTTSIHVSKKYDFKRIYAFEPEKENYKLLKINAVMNDCMNVTAVNCAVSAENTVMKLGVTNRNRGASKIILEEEPEDFLDSVEDVKVMKLDTYIEESQIDRERIRYLWIDVEGHEPKVIEGMKELLFHYKIPIFMEFTPKHMNSEDVEQLYQILSKSYKKIMVMSAADCKKRKEMEISSLQELLEVGQNREYNLFLF